MIDCKKERAPENGVEKLIASTCSVFFDGEELTVTCYSCPKFYKQGRAISDFGHCSQAAFAKPLAELTALVIFQRPCYYMQNID